jgi:putative Holliday junction resolvase
MTQQQPQQQLQPRLLSLDPGEARIGVAISDDLGLFAHPRAAIRTRSVSEAVRVIERLVAEESIAEVLIGLPLTLSGARGHQVEAVRPLVDALRAALAIPVREVDERFSSAQAVASQPKLGGKRDGTLDSASAAVVLQGVLDSRRSRVAR